MTSRHGDALAAQAVTELLEDAWHEGAAERTLDLYGPPRRTLTVRAQLIDDGRRPLGVIAMIEDVSERRRLEEIRRDFVANVSHELKTPMGALGLLAETLVSEPDVEVAQRLASRIHTEAFRVSRIIDDLLDLSRIESEEAPPREPVLVNLVMAEAVERVRATADQRGITIALFEPDAAGGRARRPAPAGLGHARPAGERRHLLLRGQPVTVSGTVDPRRRPVSRPSAARTRLTGGSAIGSTSASRPSRRPPAGTVGTVSGGPGGLEHRARRRGAGHRLGNRPEPERRLDRRRHRDPPPRHRRPRPCATCVRLSVADHGIGIPARDLDRIFERFYRVDHGRSRDTGGTGLGLSIVRHVANNHQGWVDVESREGEGSTFTLVLPLQPERLAVKRR